MDEELKYLKKLIPEQLEELIRRYEVLHMIMLLGSSGRRSIAVKLRLTERQVRAEIEHLAQGNLVLVEKNGVSITKDGVEILTGLKDMVHSLLGITLLEQKIQTLLGVKRVILTPGDCDEDELVKKDIGQAAAKALWQETTMDTTIALTGGSTMAQVAESIPQSVTRRARLIVPARGSVGHKVEQQSDTLAAKLAGKLLAEYRLLNIPDSMGTRVMNEIKNEPVVQEVLLEMQQANLLIFGIGDALTMAKKRHVSDTIYDYLLRKEAIAEFLGYYVSAEGEIVYETRSLSINLEDVKRISCVIAVAGGRKKAMGILAASKFLSQATFVLDEGAALEILHLLEKSV